MKYQDQLNPWVVHKFMPNLQRTTVARFRHRNEAEGHMKVIRQMQPYARFAIAFDVRSDDAERPAVDEAVKAVSAIG
ncbi:hypothetical protein BST81_11315 [Leptolyngbya sp. 'hensonii']|uniref:hypothetical protein n=1 Tax=Leptolyngbya sp. 'hensonii' TaxID=1922337 RepID=UPI00094F9AB3|nr:hypothetical protein [Leptolyngbya sp. 'hensonii']OLP18307.1 hypothetical protein BST81_11315 [Leptolyngbya sp. 'hensonii']